MKALIIDDEQIVLTGLRGIYDWSKNGFEKVYTTTDVGEVIEKIKTENYDLVITDIKMPEMDGLKLSEILINLNPDLYIIILSGYGEFEYAQAAISLGISEYLLKPIQRDVLETAIEKAKRSILERKRNKITFEEMQKKVETLVPLAKNNFFAEFLEEPERYAENLEEYFKEYHICLQEIPYVAIKIDLDMEIYQKEMAELDRAFLKNILLDDRNLFSSFELFVYREKIVLCIQDSKVLEDDAFLKEWLQKLNAICSRTLGFSFSSAVSQIHDKLTEINIACRECDFAFTRRFIEGGNGQFSRYENPVVGKNKTSKNFYTLVDEVVDNIKLYDIEKTIQTIDKMFAQMSAIENLFIDHYYGVAYSVLGSLFRICWETSEKDRTGELQISYDVIRKYNTLQALRDFMTDMVRQKIQKCIVEGGSSNKGVISTVISYVTDNYNKNLTLANVSEKVYLSPNYLCNLFKKELGVNFNAYLTQVRVNKAKELLKTTNLTTQYIATEIGYSDYSYFSQVFKKQTGMTPSEYKYSQIE